MVMLLSQFILALSLKSVVARWMNLVCHIELRKSERVKQISYINAHIWDLRASQVVLVV